MRAHVLRCRSGIKCHGNVGANLRLHPATCAVGTFPPRTGTGCQAASPGVAAAAAAGATDVASQQRCIEMSGQAAGAGSIRCWEGTFMSIFRWEMLPCHGQTRLHVSSETVYRASI